MKKIFKSFLASLLLVASLSGLHSVSATQEKLTLVQQLEKLNALVPYEVRSGKDSVSLKELNPDGVFDSEQLVRVVVVLNDDSVIEQATKQGVRVSDLSDAEVESLSLQLEADQANVKQQLQSEGVEFYNNSADSNLLADDSYQVVINGFSTYVAYKEIETIKQNSEVQAVFLAMEYERPKPVEVNMVASGELIGTAETNGLGFDGTGQVVAVIDSGIDPAHKDFNITDESKVALTADEVAASGLPGQYYNPKVPYAYNYYDQTQQVLDLSSDGQHGQHVAGTVGANGNADEVAANQAVKGVAPEAQILGMKVFSDDIKYSTTFSDVYVRAIEDAIKLDADVLNMSLGSPAGFVVENSIEDVALKNANANGVVATVSAGNEDNIMDSAETFSQYLAYYPYAQEKNPDNAIVGSPSVLEPSISIASVNNVASLSGQFRYSIDGALEVTKQLLNSSDVYTFGNQVTSATNADLYALQDLDGSGTLGTAGDFADVDLTDKIVLVKRGNTFTDTLANAQAAHAKGVLIYNHANGAENLIKMAGGDVAKIPFAMIGEIAGNELVKALNDGKAVQVTFPAEQALFPAADGRLMSDFSSWGPTPTLEMKPELTAPGGNIYSTQNGDSYTMMSGTSMAAPHAAGGAALVQQRLKEDALFSGLSEQQRVAMTKVLLMNTATPLQDEYGNTYAVRKQGAGLMNLPAATTTKQYVVESRTQQPKVELKEFDSSAFTVSLDVHNLADEDVTYVVSHELLKNSFISDGSTPINFIVPYVEPMQSSQSGNVEFVVEKNSTKTITLTFDFSAEALATESHVDGFITLQPVTLENGAPKLDDEGHYVTDHRTLSVPVYGFYGNWDELSVIDEYRENMNDSDISNDPTFLLTTPLYYDDAKGDLLFASANSINYIAGGSQTAPDRAKNFGFMATFLRNAELVNFYIKDTNGNVLRQLPSTYNQQKIYYMSRNRAPFKFFDNATWDGLVNGEPLAEGTEVFYEVEILRTLNSTPQVHRFKVVQDSVGPIVTNAKVDQNTFKLSFDATDSVSGAYNFGVVRLNSRGNIDTTFPMLIGGEANQGMVPELLVNPGQTHFEVDVTSLLEANKDGNLAIIAFDSIENSSITLVSVKGLTEDQVAALPEDGTVTVNNVYQESTVITGTAPAYSRVTITDEQGVEVGTETASQDGSYNMTVYPYVLVEGTKLNVVATNKQGAKTPVVITTVLPNLARVDAEVRITVDGQPLDSGADLSRFRLMFLNLEFTTPTFTKVEDGKLVAKNVRVGQYTVSSRSNPLTLTSKAQDFTITESDYVVTFNYTTKSVTPPPVYTPVTQPQIVLNSPELLSAYNNSMVAFSGYAFNIDGTVTMTANGNIDLPVKERKNQTTDLDKNFFGSLFNFNKTVNLDDQYYEMPFTVSNGTKSLTINRRFWVDTTKPTVVATVSERKSDSPTAEVVLELSDNMNLLQLTRDDNTLGTWDKTEEGFATKDIQVTYTDKVNLKQGLNTFKYKVTDIADNASDVVEVVINMVEKDALNQLIAAAEEQKLELPELQAALEKAKALSADPMANQSDIDAVVNELVNLLGEHGRPIIVGARDLEVVQNETVDLRDGVTVKDVFGADITDLLQVTPETVDTSVVGETVVTYSVTNSNGKMATKEIKVTVKPVPISTLKLEAAVEIVSGMDLTVYTTVSKDSLVAALEHAKAVLSQPQSQSQVDEALVQLNEAVKQLVVKADFTALQAEVEKAELELANSNLTEASKATLQAVVDKAKALLADDSSSQVDVNEVVNELRDVMAKLVQKANTAELEKALQAAKAVDLTKLPKYMKALLEQAIAQAQQALEQDESTQALVDQLTDKLNKLVELANNYQPPHPIDPIGPDNPNNPDDPVNPDGSKVVLVDAKTKVTVSFDRTAFNGDVTLFVEKVAYPVAGNVTEAYEIHFLNAQGEVVQPTSPVTVTMPLGQLSKDGLSVYHVVNGEHKLVSHTLNGNNAVFAADSFSIYYLANKAKTNTNSLPDSGYSNDSLWLVGSVILLSGVWMLVLRKKQEH